MLNSRLTLLAERQMLLNMHQSVGENPTKGYLGTSTWPNYKSDIISHYDSHYSGEKGISVDLDLRLDSLGSFYFVLIALGSCILSIYTNTSDRVSEVARSIFSTFICTHKCRRGA